MNQRRKTLAARLGMPTHISVLRIKLGTLERQYPSNGVECIEDWLVDVANTRGAYIIYRKAANDPAFISPPEKEFSNEELVVALCQLQCLDRPQILRLAAQLISRKVVNADRLKLIIRRERAGVIIGELARQALHVDPEHELWRELFETFGREGGLAEPILHWTRLAEPVMRKGRYNASAWRLVS